LVLGEFILGTGYFVLATMGFRIIERFAVRRATIEAF
jgi:hypothetical protein